MTGDLDAAKAARYASEMALARELSVDLCRTYPGYHWGVDVDQGLVKIFNGELSGNRAFVVHRAKHAYSWASMRDACRKGAGEMLERWKLSRVRRDEAQVQSLARRFDGEAVGDISNG